MVSWGGVLLENTVPLIGGGTTMSGRRWALLAMSVMAFPVTGAVMWWHVVYRNGWFWGALGINLIAMFCVLHIVISELTRYGSWRGRSAWWVIVLLVGLYKLAATEAGTIAHWYWFLFVIAGVASLGRALPLERMFERKRVRHYYYR